MMDYRSDTVTRPTAAMKQFMMNAPMGDDVFGDDPSVNELETKIAGLFNMEAALFCPSGTMTNQIAIKVHTRPGDEVICSDLAHVYGHEGGGMAANSGVQPKILKGDRGRITSGQLLEAINENDIHKPVSRLVCLENTVNMGGGCCYDFEEIKNIREVCNRNQLKLHLDGARLFNALVAKNETPAQYDHAFDSISICLSKGLGCPVGSVLLGNAHFIREARRIRKRMGGGMRQAGILAAAGIFALEHHVSRLTEDHKHALQVAGVLKLKKFVAGILPVETNILIFEVIGEYTAAQLSQKLEEYEIRTISISKTQIRMVFHLDITKEMVEKSCEIIDKL